jgi:hypothetical protein
MLNNCYVQPLRTIENLIVVDRQRTEAERQQDAPRDILHHDRAGIPPESLNIVLEIMGRSLGELENFHYVMGTGRNMLVTPPGLAALRHIGVGDAKALGIIAQGPTWTPTEEEARAMAQAAMREIRSRGRMEHER